jgi:hypothetical protein
MDQSVDGAVPGRTAGQDGGKGEEKMRVMGMIGLMLAACTLAYATDMGPGSIYTWTDQSGVVHITDSAPPPGVEAEHEVNNPPESPPADRGRLLQPGSIRDWEVRQAEQRARQAEQEMQQAERNARQAQREAEQTVQKSRQYIDTHDNNQYMRWAFKYQLKQARNAIQASEARAHQEADNFEQAKQNAEAARQQLKEAQDFAGLDRSN